MAVRARWRAAGRTVQELSKLDTISIEITDLPGAMLAEARGSSIAIDRTAAGWGWFVDPTPFDDREFDAGTASAAAAGRIDLLTTLVHEMLHGLGHADLDPALHPDDVMAGSLPRGTRRLTTTGQAATNVVAPAFTLPAGRSVTITLDATINKPFPFGVGQVSLQASISADALATVLSDDPSTARPERRDGHRRVVSGGHRESGVNRRRHRRPVLLADLHAVRRPRRRHLRRGRQRFRRA